MFTTHFTLKAGLLQLNESCKLAAFRYRMDCFFMTSQVHCTRRQCQRTCTCISCYSEHNATRTQRKQILIHFLCNACFDWLLSDVNVGTDGHKQIMTSLRFVMTSSYVINTKITNVLHFVDNDRILKGGA